MPLTPLEGFPRQQPAVRITYTCFVLQVAEIFDILSKDFPGSAIYASTFDHYVEALLEYMPRIGNWPTVTQEIGDTWVYGAAPAF